MSVASWMSDRAIRRLISNGGVLLTGQLAGALFGALALAFTARALGPTELGILVLAQTYALVIARLVSSQSWQAVIKYGTTLLEQSRYARFNGLLVACFGIEAAFALIGASLAWVIASAGAGHFEWTGDVAFATALYSLTIAFNVVGTPIGVMRVFNRYRLVATQTAAVAMVKAVAVFIAWYAGGGLHAFLLIWVSAEIFSYITTVALAGWVLHAEGVLKYGCSSLRHVAALTGFWSFVWSTNVHATIRAATREADILLVGGIAGPASAGVFKVAKQFSAMLARCVDPFYQAIYPDLASLWSQGAVTQFRRLIVRAGSIAAIFALAVWTVMILTGKALLDFTVGSDFLGAYPTMIAYMFAMVLSVGGFPLHPALLASGRPRTALGIVLIATLAYYVLLFPLLSQYGALGASLAYVGFYLIWLCMMGCAVQRATNSHARAQLVRAPV